MVVGPEPAVKGRGAFGAGPVDRAVGPAAEQGADEALDSPMSRGIHRWRRVGPGEQASVDDVGEVAFERAAGFSGCLALVDLASEECLGVGVMALLDDRDAVERGVELAVAGSAEAVAGVSG